MFKIYNKKCCSLILIISLSLGIARGSIQPSKIEKPSILTSAWARPAMGLGYLLLSWMRAPHDVRENLKKQLNPTSLLLNFICQYSQWWASTLCHESGHSLMHRYLTGKSNTIHLGYSKHEKNRKPWFTICNINIEGIDPQAGHTHIEYELSKDDSKKINQFILDCAKTLRIDTNNIDQETIEKILKSSAFKDFKQSLDIDKEKYAAILLAGGSAGILCNHLFKLIKGGPKEAIKVDPITINNLFNMLIPIDANSDAAQLYKQCLGVSPKIIDNLATIGQVIQVASLIGIDCYQSYRDKQTTISASLEDRFLIAVVNYLLMGYLKFHA